MIRLLFSLCLLCQVWQNEGSTVDFTLLKYHNFTASCQDIPGTPCNFKLSMTIIGASTRKTHKFVRSSSFPTDVSHDIIFSKGDDGLGKSLRNPQIVQLTNDTVEDLRVRVKVFDTDYSTEIDKFISKFVLDLGLTSAQSGVEHNDSLTRGTGQLDFAYKVYCDGNHGGIGCCGCINNYYNTNCTKFCQPINNFTCDSNGDHICKPNYYNTSCNVHCVPTSQYNCSQNGTRGCLGRWTGDRCDVQTPCPSGKFGMNCSVNCTAVPNQYTCNSTTGEKVCETHWTGSECDSCSPNYYGANCNTFCQASSAMNCSNTGEKKCLGHFTGQNCSLCETGWYGSGCDLYCDLNSTLWTCDDHGNKICSGERAGTDCTDCKQGWFGQDCSVECTDTEKYKCTDQGDKTCTSNWNGPNCDRCKEMYFGPNCTCKREPGRAECDNEGVLHCLGHWTGQLCDICIPGYSGPLCLIQNEASALDSLPRFSKSLLIFCIMTGVVFSLAAGIALYGVCNDKRIRRRSSLKIKPALEPSVHWSLAYKNPHFVETPSPTTETKIRIEFIEDM